MVAKSPAPAAERLPFRTKLAFGVGSAAESLSLYSVSSFALLFYNQVLGVPAGWVALALSASLFFDALSDPIVGSLSDRTRSRWGRRHVYMYFAPIPVALCLFAIFAPPPPFAPSSARAGRRTPRLRPTGGARACAAAWSRARRMGFVNLPGGKGCSPGAVLADSEGDSGRGGEEAGSAEIRGSAGPGRLHLASPIRVTRKVALRDAPAPTRVAFATSCRNKAV